MRIKMTLSYDGSFFSGFQTQNDPSISTVADALQKSLAKINITSTLIGSGRTDAGVHALSQVVHVDIPSFWNNLENLRANLNRFLQPHIYIKAITPVEADFHARFHAKKRLYRYIMYDGAYQPFLANYALHIKPLDIQKLDAYAKEFVGNHSFGYFKKVGGGATKDERIIFKAGAYRYKHFIVLYFLGDAFLRSQVRMMSDCLLKACYDEISLDDLQDQRDVKKRVTTTLTPACGLYLSRIYY